MSISTAARLARSWLLLPVYLVTDVLLPWLKFSAASQQAYGHSRVRQLMEVVRGTLTSGPCGRKGYYRSCLARHKGGKELASYIHDQFHETQVAFCRYAVTRLLGDQPQLGNKYSLALLCRQAGVPSVITLAAVSQDGSVEWMAEDAKAQMQAAQSLFVKPSHGTQGQHAQRWDNASGSFTSNNGTLAKSADAVISEVASLARQTGRQMLVQLAISNSKEIQSYGSRAVSTVRLVTLLSHNGDIMPVQAGMRFGGTADGIVDNYSAGGIYFVADHHTGELLTGLATTAAQKPEFKTTPPLSNKVVTGTIIPRWKEVVDLAKTAHRAMTRHTICGWDIAVTEDGPVIVECNDIPGCPVAGQRPNGFYGTDYSKFLHREILYYLNQLEPENSRFRFKTGIEQS